MTQLRSKPEEVEEKTSIVCRYLGRARGFACGNSNSHRDYRAGALVIGLQSVTGEQHG